MISNTRLGKRSPFGALVGSSCPDATRTAIAVGTDAGQPGISRVRGHGDLKVYFQCGGADAVSRAASSCIDVPRRFGSSPSSAPQEVDMDELMAAMVLSSLSCSPPPPRSSAPKETPDPSGRAMDGGGVQLWDSGSSGYWSVDRARRSSASSSPPLEADGGSSSDMDQEPVLFEEPAPRRRRNSLRASYRCLWPSCGKELTSVVGIKRHIRTVHLCHGGGEHERCSRSEEDFYYTEVNQWEEPPPQSPPTAPASGPAPSPPSPPAPCSSLSRSAPSPCSSFWQVQSEHSYQAPPLSHMVSPASSASCRLTAPPTTCSRQGAAFRTRSVSVGEQWLQHHSAPCRRIRSEAKKCRKVYGIEHRELWCTACRWKKACQRFLD